jgi:hypothetical protein
MFRQFQRREIRVTCVSTTTPSFFLNQPSTTFAPCVRAGSAPPSPPKSATILRAAPTTDFDLLRKKPVERMSGSNCSGFERGEILDGRILLKQHRRDHVHPHVRALRGKNRSHQQFPGAAVGESAGHSGIKLVKAGDDLTNALGRQRIISWKAIYFSRLAAFRRTRDQPVSGSGRFSTALRGIATAVPRGFS